MYVCNCNGISERQVREALEERPRSAHCVFRRYDARPRCGRCVPEIQAMVQQPENGGHANASR